MSIKRQRGINLVWVSILSMCVAAAGMATLYTIRYGHLPFQETLSRWQSSGKVIGNELKKATNMGDLHAPGLANEEGPPPVTVQTGVRRCLIDGKTVISNTECTDQNPTTKLMKLHDTQGFVHPKPAQAEQSGSSDPGTDVRRKMIDKIIDKSGH